ncbi:MAG: DUF4912 domain-containing protein [Spirochaetaceae bacterium]
MTKEKLRTLSQEALKTVARREGIVNQDHVSREQLIDLIVEALEEDKIESHRTNNCAMRLENKKYDILKDEELEVLQFEDFKLPERYNSTRIVLLLRDPEWAYVYWDLNSSKLEELKNQPNYGGLFLRVYEYRGVFPSKSNLVDFFDIEVEEEDDSRYISLNKPGNDYRVELYASVLHKEESLAVSNPVHSPLGYIVRNKEDFYSNPNTMMLMLSGLWDYGSEEEEETLIPQRIISILDSHDFDIIKER